MRAFIKRGLGLCMAMILLIYLTACNGNSNDDNATTGRYEITILSTMIQGVQDMERVDGTPFILAYDKSYNTGIYKLDIDTGTLALIYNSTGAISIAPDRQGGLWVLEIEYDENTEDTSNLLKHLGMDGTVLETKEIAVVMDSNNSTSMTSDGDGNLYINDYGKIYLVDTNGSYVGEVAVSEYALELAVTTNGQVMTYDTGEEAFCTVDWNTKAYADIYSFDAPRKGLMDGDDVYDVYFYDTEGIYGYNIGNETADQILLWQENNIASLYYCGIIDQKHFIIYDTSLLMLGYTEEEMTQKTTLTLASMGPGQMITDAIAAYNRSNNQYQVEIVDYSEYNTSESDRTGLNKLNTEIIAGDGPDLVDLTGLPVQQYVQKGLLTEFGPLFDKDESISRGDYLENILSALEIDGKLYSITPIFRVATVLGRTSQVGADMGWTYESFQSLVNEASSAAFANLTCYEVLEQLFEANQGLFIDFENSICDFTSDSFVQLLEMAAEYPQDIDTANYTSSVIQLERGDALLVPITLYGNVYYSLYESILGDDITFIGYPTPNGSGGRSIVPIEELGILSNSPNVGGAWEVLCYLLSKNIQDGFEVNFPIMKSSLNDTLESFTDFGATTNGGIFSTEIDGEWVEVAIYELSEEAVNRFRLLIESLDTVKRDNAALVDIILEEAGFYFNGDRSGDETAAIIQNRISTYLSELS